MPRPWSEIVQRRAPIYDKAQEGHYNLISALHKTVRGSDPDAALYYLARMLDAGEDRLFIARRLVRMAVEDIGLADPQALVVANAAKDAFDFLGSPEGELALAQAAIYLATAPKSNAVYPAFKAATRARQGAWLPAAAEDHPQRADQADEARGLRRGLPLRPRRARRLLGPGLLARRARPPAALPARPSAASRPGSPSAWSGGRRCASSGAGRGRRPQRASGALSTTSLITKKVRAWCTPGRPISVALWSRLKSAMSETRIFRM